MVRLPNPYSRVSPVSKKFNQVLMLADNLRQFSVDKLDKIFAPRHTDEQTPSVASLSSPTRPPSLPIRHWPIVSESRSKFNQAGKLERPKISDATLSNPIVPLQSMITS